MKDGYTKWLCSTKFQITCLCLVLIYLQQSFYGLNPAVATDALLKICLAYLAARILEPVVDFIVKTREPK